MLREQLSEAYKTAMRDKDKIAVSTLRLIMAALKDRDIAARTKGETEGVDEAEIQEMLQKMVRQRRDSIDLYEQGGRLELVEQEQNEIAIIERFLPKPLSDDEIAAAVDSVIQEIGAEGIKDIGRCMGRLKEQHAGRMDFSKASALVRSRLSG